jgi:hypothetical protein
MRIPHICAIVFAGTLMNLAVPDVLADDAVRPVATNHSTLLYATQTTSDEGETEVLASHKVMNGSAHFTWDADTVAAGDYLVVINYSSDLGGVRVEVDSAASSVTGTLDPTARVFPATDLWYQRSFARHRLPGSLRLGAGEKAIGLTVTPASAEDIVAVRALELLPTSDVADARAEIESAELARPEAEWFSDLRYGLMFHWTSQAAPRSGASLDYATAVKEFNVQAFVQMVDSTGADYIIFTTNHADPHFPAPLDDWEQLHPGQTTQRDLIREIAGALAQHGIKLILYFATHVYADLEDANEEHFVDANIRLLTEVGNRYGRSVVGYWLDGWYQAAEKYGKLPYERIYRASKAGNPDRLLALNSWIYPIVSPWQDYWAGETYSIPTEPSARISENGPGAGLRYHALLALEGGWVHTEHDTAIPAPVLETDKLLEFIDASASKGPVTLNVLIYQDGTISELSMNVLKKIRDHLSAELQ